MVITMKQGYNYQEAQRPFIPERKDTIVESVIGKVQGTSRNRF